jgi:hypothetical protein
MDPGDRLGMLRFLIHDCDPVFGAAFGQLCWLYKRGQAAGAERARRDAARAEDKAKVEDLSDS